LGKGCSTFSSKLTKTTPFNVYIFAALAVVISWEWTGALIKSISLISRTVLHLEERVLLLRVSDRRRRFGK